jgi:hypothetical protein
MIEYPSIISSSKAPRKPMIAFEKIDGSNIRIKWTNKKGFCLFGSRENLIDETHPHLGGVINLFNSTFGPELDYIIRKNFPNEKELIAYGEYWGPNSFAGIHVDPVDQMRLTIFDLLVVKKSYNEFLLPQEFIKVMSDSHVPVPRIAYDGILGEDFIQHVRNNDLEIPLTEGVVCKGREKTGAFRGKVWMCKIKTNQYMEKLKMRHGNDWNKFWE